MKRLALAALMAFAAGCGSSGGGSGVADKVLTDFGLREKPDGYVEPSDKVYDRLDTVGKQEMSRMNAESRHGVVKFEQSGTLGGAYYKEVKLYEDYRPIDAQRMSRNSQSERGYVGFIDYTYRIFQSERRPNKTEVDALSATIPTGDEGRETLRYTFGPAGEWNGYPGEPVRR